jgi:hypothetical protein
VYIVGLYSIYTNLELPPSGIDPLGLGALGALGVLGPPHTGPASSSYAAFYAEGGGLVCSDHPRTPQSGFGGLLMLRGAANHDGPR